MATQTFTHAIIHVGAPYCDHESGHIHSRHKSYENAKKRFSRDFDGTVGVINNRIVKLKKDGTWDFSVDPE